jgi:hypothetical protein
LKYEWTLVDERSTEIRVPAWDQARPEEREDRVTASGPITEFCQSFTLRLPATLAMGRYRIKATVTDVHTDKSDCVFVPITVAAEGKR